MKNLLKTYNNDVGIQSQRFISFWWNHVHEMDNTKYSWELLSILYDPLDEHQLPVIQSKYGDLESLLNYCDKFITYFGKSDKIAVGSVCKMDSHKTSARMLKEVRRKFRNSWIHAFGLRYKALKLSLYYINSFDSTAWTFPRQSGRPSCKNNEMCISYFYDYLCELNKLKYKNHGQTQLSEVKV